MYTLEKQKNKQTEEKLTNKMGRKEVTNKRYNNQVNSISENDLNMRRKGQKVTNYRRCAKEMRKPFE